MPIPRKVHVDNWRREFGRDLEYSIVLDIFRTSRLVTRGIEQVLEEYELTMAQWTILTVVFFAEDQRLALGKIAEMVAVHTSTVTNAVDKLQASGWMIREPLDRRTVLAILTPEGGRRLRKLQESLVDNHFGIRPIKSQTEATTILEALSRIQARSVDT